jgi:ferredoxin-NADP reductase
MAPEILYWLQDVREHLRVSQRRKALRQPGQGFDYAVRKDTVQDIVSRLHPERMHLRVVEVVQETPTTKTFRFERLDGPLPPFRAGQYVNVFVDVDGVLTSRPYSISSPPPTGDTAPSPPSGTGGETPQTLDLTVRDKPGGFVAPYLLNEVQAGDELETTGPAGHFYHEPLIDGGELVFLAGGSGITPFVSIIRDALRRGAGTPALRMYLLYGSRVLDDVIFGEELAELAARHPNLRYALVISEPPHGRERVHQERPYLTGFLCADLIREQVGDVADKTFYICGPNLMYDFCLNALQELGVPGYKIKRELYGPPDDVTQDPGWPQDLSPDTLFEVIVEVSGLEAPKTIRASAGEPLLNSLERFGLVVPAICRAGECSACRTRLVSGKVLQPAHTGLRESDRLHGYIHACVSYPLADLRIRL